jgi:hypothetical protein
VGNKEADMKRVFLDKYDSTGQLPSGLIRLDVYFHSSDGERYVWTPDWKGVTRQFLEEAYDVEKLNVPETKRERIGVETVEVTVKKGEEKVERIDMEPIAFRVGELLKRKVSLELINREALSLFDFTSTLHNHPRISNINSQTIYDWVMTLGEQPIGNEKKLELLKKFVRTISPPDTPLAKVV